MLKFIIIMIAAALFVHYATPTFKRFAEDSDAPAACTMEAKLCPDGSSVGRTGPNCAFAPCSAE